MTENLHWENRSSKKNVLAEKLQVLVNDVVLIELNDINAKIESLCSMGVLDNSEQLNELREKMRQLHTGKKQ
jgi:hypothetical protein